jgi:hypothetical protein
VKTSRDIIRKVNDKVVAEAQKERAAKPQPHSRSPRVRILGSPARDELDHVALEMFGQLLDSSKWDVELLPVELLTAELLDRIIEEDPPVICIASVPQDGLANTRYLCKRLRAKFPRLKIFVGRFGQNDDQLEVEREFLYEAGADEVESTLLAMRDKLRAWYPIFAAEKRDLITEGAPNEPVEEQAGIAG